MAKTDTRIFEKFGMSTRTLQDWKNKEGNYREKVYLFLQADSKDFMAQIFIGKDLKQEEINNVSSFLESVFLFLKDKDTTQDLLRLFTESETLFADNNIASWDIDTFQKIVSLYNLKDNFKTIFD